MLIAEESLFSAEELERIDCLIQANMNTHLQSILSDRIALMLQEEVQSYQINCSAFQAETYEESICLIVNQLSENWARKEENYSSLISSSSQQRQKLSLLNTEKDNLISEHIEQLRKLSTRLVEEIREKNQMIGKNFSLREQINTTKVALVEQIQQKSIIIERQSAKIDQLTTQLEEAKGNYEEISIENAALRESKDLLEKQIQDLLQQLAEDIERHKLNFITSNIMVQQLQQQQEEKLKQIAKYARIHEQNKSVINILGKVMQLSEVHLQDFKAEEFNDPSSIYNQFDHLMSERNAIALHISTFTASISEFSRIFYQNKSQLAAYSDTNANLERELSKLQQLYQVQIKNKSTLEAQLSNQKHEHYCALLDVDRSKRNIEDSLIQTLQNVKRMELKIQILQEQIKQKDSNTKQLSQLLDKATSQNEQLKHTLKNEQQNNYELKEEILNMKSNLDMMMKTEQDDEDCNFNIVQQLIDKNNELTSQITTKKLQIDLNQEKMAYQESIIEKQAIQIDNLMQEIKKMKEIVKKKEEQMKKQEKEYNVLTQRYAILENYMKEEKELKIQQMKTYCHQENQTDPIKDTVQSRIKRQIVRQSVRSQVQKSHSLLSDKEENKENIVDHNTANRNLLSSREKEGYKEKIMTLNEIINYMLNYCKGYGQGEIRKGSWFMNQIAKYGSQYEERLLDQSHLAAKLKNMKFIEGICRQDQNCSKLIREYETVIEFYLGRCNKMSNSSVSVSPITQEQLNKTVNKSRHHQSNQYVF